jgi:prophage tail gpP-like protein
MSYSVDSDLWLAADAFSFTATDPDHEIEAGMRVDMWVNNEKELVGVIDKVEQKITKKGKELSISGRDLMGLLCDHNIIEYQSTTDLSKAALKMVAETIMKDILLVSIKDIVYEGAAVRLAVPFEQYILSPGQTVFDVLKSIAQGRGLHFWCREDGSFVFGKLVTSGAPQYRFVLEKTSDRTNILEASKITDISQGFSKIIVHSQAQDADVDDVAATESLAIPSEFPFYKPKVVCINGDKKSAYYEAKKFINISKANALQLQYVVAGHSQGTNNYKTNVIARVDDEENNIHGDFLVSGRTLTLDSKKSGPRTQIRLCRTGVIMDK